MIEVDVDLVCTSVKKAGVGPVNGRRALFFGGGGWAQRCIQHIFFDPTDRAKEFSLESTDSR